MLNPNNVKPIKNNKKGKLKIWCDYCRKMVFVEYVDILKDEKGNNCCDCPECGYELTNLKIK